VASGGSPAVADAVGITSEVVGGLAFDVALFYLPGKIPSAFRLLPKSVGPMEAGIKFEARQLTELGLAKNTGVWRPTVAQTQSAVLKVVVGKPKYSLGGQLRGTILDSVETGFLELKHGRSVLGSTYQLRLQTYRALIEGKPLTLRTKRPINPAFREWLIRWGVKIEELK
jgi:hypothetical protein